VKFFCDNDVDAAVAAALRDSGHDAWTAAEAGLAASLDDDLTVYAHEHAAVLITHDKEFSNRRKKNVVGKHVFMRCNEWDAADLLVEHLDALLRVLGAFDDLWASVSKEGVYFSHEWT